MKVEEGTTWISAYFHWILLMALTLPPSGCASKMSAQTGWDSPEDVYQAGKAAAAKKDWEGVLNCFSPRGQEKLVKTMYVAAGMFIALKDDEGKPLEAILNKYGIKLLDSSPISEEENKKIAKNNEQILKGISNKVEFVEDVVGFFQKLNPQDPRRKTTLRISALPAF